MMNVLTLTSLKSPGGRRIVEDIAQKVRSGELIQGQRLTPLRLLADQYSVSIGTARVAVAKLEKMGLIFRKQGSGTYVSYSPEQDFHEKMIHLMLRCKEDLYDVLMKQVIENLRVKGYPTVNIGYAHHAQEHAMLETFAWWKQRLPNALVLQVSDKQTVRLIQKHVPQSTRVIAAFSPMSIIPSQWSLVTANTTDAYLLAAERLIQAGHTRLGILENDVLPGARDEIAWQRLEHRHRIRAINELLKRSGIDQPIRVHINQYHETKGCDPFVEDNLQRLEEFLQSPDRPTGFIGQDNRMVAVQRVAQNLGLKIREDVSLVGIYNTPWAVAGGLTSISMQEDLVAQQIAELVAVKEEQMKSSVRHIFIQPRIVERESV